MTTDKYPDETHADAPTLPDPTPTISGAAWKEGVIPTPPATTPSATGSDANPPKEGAADIAPDMKDDMAPIAKGAEAADGSGTEEAEPAANGSSLRHWITIGLLAVGLAALLAKIKR
ncbi:hypothetical protein [Niveispirillum sp. KHB5.9]|uniref:hypothetical protein n=1 Tax=Niveispirillum sp. KHB5.9 TaxID=3400269 RepID=UPI003A880405